MDSVQLKLDTVQLKLDTVQLRGLCPTPLAVDSCCVQWKWGWTQPAKLDSVQLKLDTVQLESNLGPRSWTESSLNPTLALEVGLNPTLDQFSTRDWNESDFGGPESNFSQRSCIWVETQNNSAKNSLDYCSRLRGARNEMSIEGAIPKEHCILTPLVSMLSGEAAATAAQVLLSGSKN